MTKLLSLLLLLSVCTFSGLLSAQDAAQDAANERLWGVETELIQPFVPTVGIFAIKATRTVWGNPTGVHGDVMGGLYLRPRVAHDVVKTIDEYMLTAGYRQYVWRGLHAEAQILGGYAWGKENLFDGKDYEGAVFFWETNIGYRFDLGHADKMRLYVTPQFGYLAGVNDALIIGPRGGKPDTFWQGKLLIGLRF